MITSFYSDSELASLGLKQYGANVFISRKASLYNPESIEIGDNVRIDDFCILSGSIRLHSYIHISAFCALYGSMGIEIHSFSGLSPRVTIFSAMDDFRGDFLINPMVPSMLTKVDGGRVVIMKYCQIGSGSILFPKLTVDIGTVVGAMSLVRTDLDSWSIYAGVPAKFLKPRNKGLLSKLSLLPENEKYL